MSGPGQTSHDGGVPSAAALFAAEDIAAGVEAMEHCTTLPNVSDGAASLPLPPIDDERRAAPEENQDTCLEVREGTLVLGTGAASDSTLACEIEADSLTPGTNDPIASAPENIPRERSDRTYRDPEVARRAAYTTDARNVCGSPSNPLASLGPMSGGTLNDLASCLEEPVLQVENCSVSVVTAARAVGGLGEVVEDSGVQSSVDAGIVPAAIKTNAENDSSSEASADTESSSSSDSDSDSDAGPAGPTAHSRIRRELAAAEVVEPESDEDGRVDPARTKNEQDPDNIVVPPIDIEISPEFSLFPIGVIKSIMEKVIVIESLPNALASKPVALNPYARTPDAISSSVALDMDTVICLSDSRRPLGRIFETFGPVTSPFYVVRFNSRADIQKFGNTAHVGAQVSYVREMSCMVVAGDIRRKGYDASNINDEELPTERLDHSDDEAEAAAKRVKKRGSSGASVVDVDGVVGGSGVRQKRPNNYGARGGRHNVKGDHVPHGDPSAGYQDRRSRSVRGEHHSLFQNQLAPRRPNPGVPGQGIARARTVYGDPSLPVHDGSSQLDPLRGVVPQPLYHNGIAIPSIHPMMARQFLRQQHFGQQGEFRAEPGQGLTSNATGTTPDPAMLSGPIPNRSIPSCPTPYVDPQSPWRAQIHVPYHGFISSGTVNPAMSFHPQLPNPQLGVGYPGLPIPFSNGNFVHGQTLQARAGNGLQYQAPQYRPLGPATPLMQNPNPVFSYDSVPYNMPQNPSSWEAARGQPRRHFPPDSRHPDSRQ